MVSVSFSKFSTHICGILLAACVAFVAHAPAAMAETTSSWGTSRVLQEALSTRDHVNIYDNNRPQGFNLSGGLFSGRASGIDTTANGYLSNSMNDGMHYDSTAELEGDQRVYAMLLDGSYHFDNDLGTGLPLHPYMSGGVGMAVYDGAGTTSSNLGMQGGDMVPLFRVGGGVAYQLGEEWNMSVDYKVGFSGGNSPLLNHGGAQPADMQTINMGMHYRF